VSSVDMRQLALVVALVDTQSLSQAAERLGLTPSAASQSLQRLRESFGDELVVRQGTGYLLTAPGQRVLESFREMVQLWHEASSGGSFFDPASSDAHFCIACVEGLVEIDLDACYGAIVTRAPRIRLDVREPDLESGGYVGLHASSIDVLLTTVAPPGDAQDLHAERLPDAVFTHCCLSVSHPRIGDSLSMREYLAEHHLLASATVRLNAKGSATDQWLVHAGYGARTSSSVYPVSRLAFVLSTTDRLATVSVRQGAVLRRHADGLRLLPLPPELPRSRSSRYMVWHHRTHHSPPHRWLRERLREYAVADAGPGERAEPPEAPDLSA
jgi:LysR family nod box-dependent transcriptional activator